MNEMLSGDFPQPTLPDPADMPTVDDLVGAVRRAERRAGSLVTCSNCGWSCRCSSDGLALEEGDVVMPPVDLTRTTMAGVCIQTRPHDLWRVVHRSEVRNALHNTQIGADDTALLYGWRVDESDCNELIRLMDTATDRQRAS